MSGKARGSDPGRERAARTVGAVSLGPMVPLRVRTQPSLSPAERDDIAAFLELAMQHDGARLNDHLLTDLNHGRTDGFWAAIASHDGSIRGYAQASTANDGVIVGCVVPAGDHSTPALLLRALLAELPASTRVTWWSSDASAATAAELGMRADRRLLQMTRSLPIPDTSDVAVRPFRVGVDEAEWLALNNAAFAWHGEQGGWDLATLQQREREPWFAPEGFLLHEREGRLAAFCWTKLHSGASLVGEIYVIAVHPQFHGLGLGRALTVAGLQHLQSVGAASAMLFVDADNASAVGLYRALGFDVDHADQSYLRPPQGDTP